MDCLPQESRGRMNQAQGASLSKAQEYEQQRDYAKAADVYVELGAYKQAETLYHRLEAQLPFNKDLKFKLGRLLTLTKQWDEAILKLQDVTQVGRYLEETLYLLAECFTQKGLIHAAREMYVDLLERNYHYKDARSKLHALETPSFSALALTLHPTRLTAGAQPEREGDATYVTMQGLAVEDRYTIVAELGRGGMGIVYQAEDRVEQRLVAIKVLPPYLATEKINRVRFFREAEAIAGLHHPHIVRIFETNQLENFLVMEYVPGGTLTTWQRQHGLRGEAMLPFLGQILDALTTVHQQGLIHRDLKPENILIADATTAKLTDFGIAHICGATITHTGTHLGTLPYMAPEQILGTPVDARTDIYAVGVMLYELLTGVLPFTGKDTSFHHIHTPPCAPREHAPALSAELNQLILKCLAKRPADRCQSALELRQALGAQATGF